ncbi:MAG: Ig-like domain-containing protein [Nitriliruptorales bacterium]
MRFLVIAAVIMPIAVTASAAPSGPPAGVTGIALDGRVELAWQPVSGATGYTVYRGTSPNAINTRLTAAQGIPGTSYADTSAVNGTSYYYAVRAVEGGAESSSSGPVQATPAGRACSTGNPVVLENCFPGSPNWRVVNAGSVAGGGIEGFATATSIDKGEPVDLKVNVQTGSTFRVEIYRSGYYGGDGARLFSTISGIPGVLQPSCVENNVSGLVDCSNWTASATITTTSSWPSGVYLLRLVREDNGADNHILLAVRDDASDSDVLYGVAFTDFQAYNNYGGKSLYDSSSTGGTTISGAQRAVEVSFDRPFEQPRSGRRDWYVRIDYPLVYWLEREGYDVSYQSNTDLEAAGALVSAHDAYISPAHDEYYSAGMRNALEQARDSGTNLFFTGSNEIYWKVRFTDSPISGGNDRVMVCYKTTQSGGPDPSGIHTGTWRDPAGANDPENALTGVMYVGDNDFTFFPLVVSATEGSDRIWRYTGLDTQAPGTSTTVGGDLVGWEWDARVSNGREPAGVKTLASSPANGNLLQYDEAAGRNFYTEGSATHQMVKYTAASGALVVTTGTNYWARGLALDGFGAGDPDVRIQQATTNILADMGAVPATPAADITLDNQSSTRPPAPSGVAAQTAGTDSIDLSWQPVAGAAGYNVYRSVAPREGGQPLGTRANGSLVTGTSFTDVGLASATTYYYVVTTVAGGEQSVASAESSATTSAAAGQPTRIESGGTDYTASTGAFFRTDAFFTGGNTASSSVAIAGTNDPTLYQTERWGNFTYAIPVVDGTYDVRMHFAETYYGTDAPGGSGQRVFSLDIGDTPASPDIQNLDIYAEVGAATALVRSFPDVVVTDGALDLQAIDGPADDPTIAAIEIVPQAIPPSVTTTSPANGATGVSRGSTVQATFSMDMDGSTITSSSFTLTPADGSAVPATVTYDAASRTATLTPSSALDFSTAYTARLETTVAAPDGETLITPESWTFTTEDPVPPQVTSTSPQDGAADVSPSARPRAAFSRPLDPATVNESTFALTGPGGQVAATVSYDSSAAEATLTPSAQLATSTTYTARLDSAVTGADGVPLAAPVTWSFTTAASAPLPPTVDSLVPLDGATGVARTTAVQAVFSRDMDAGSVTASTFTLTGAGGEVQASVAYDASTRTATLTPAALLAYSTSYTARLTTGVTAVDGTPLAGDVTWAFTTADPPPPPTVVARSPADGSSYVGRATAVTATFSRAMDGSTIGSSSFTLTGPSGEVPASVSYDASSHVATLTPNAPLGGGADYTAKIEASVAAEDGAPLAAPVTWSFSTAACPCTLFSPILIPAKDNNPTQDGRTGTGPWSYELGMKVRVDQPMLLTAIRFWKSSAETGTHVGRVWTSGGAQLAQTTFAAEGAFGWQQQGLAAPLTLQPDATYVVSVNANAYFPITKLGLANQVVSGPLHTVADGQNGVFGSAAGVFPTQTSSSSNYFVDLEVVPDGDPAPPTVLSTTPPDAAAEIEREATVRAAFSRPLDPATVSGSTFTLTGPGGPVAATVAYDDATTTATLTPAAPLSYATTYAASLTTAVRARDGMPLSAPVQWSFTVKDPVPPTVTSTAPSAGASDVGPGVRARAEFDKELKPETVTAATFTLAGPGGSVPAAVAYDPATRTATLTPNSPLTVGATYTARLDPSITATDDATLATPYTWSFTVASDLPAPTVSAASPADGEGFVARSAEVTATFSRSMDFTTLTSSSFTLQEPSGAFVPAAVAYDSETRTATLTPADLLEPTTEYTARVETSATAADGTPFTSAEAWSFSTAACPCRLFSPVLQPQDQGLPTRDGRPPPGPWTYEMGVKVTVDQPMRLTAIRFYKSPGETGAHIGRVWTAGGVQLAETTFAAESASGWQQQGLAAPLALQPGSTYVVSVNTNAYYVMTMFGLQSQAISGPLRSVADGQNGVHSSAAGAFPTQFWNASNYFVDLEVVPDGDPAPPTVLSTTPADAAPGVDRSTSVHAVFSRPIEPATISGSTFTLTGPSGPVPATVAYDDAGDAAVLTPSAPLAYSTTYTAELTTDVRASDGMPLSAPVQWSFTVEDAVPPTVTSVLPVDGASAIGPTVQPRAQFSKDLKPETVNASTFTLTGPGGAVAATVAYDQGTRAATLTPASPLAEGAYTARLDASITATDDATLATPFSWSFTVADVSALAVSSTDPASGAADVSRTPSVKVTFNRSVDPTTVTTDTFRLHAPDGTLVPATVSYDPATLTGTLAPGILLAPTATFTAEVTTGVLAADGTPLGATTTWSFTTTLCPCSLFPDTLTPALTGNPTRDGRPRPGPWSYELGVKITVDRPATLEAIRFYKDAKETGTHVGKVWRADGTQLATTTLTGESAAGWQQQALASPIQLEANTVYVVSVNMNAYYVVTQFGLQSQVVSGPLRSVADGQNGVYGSAAGIFPTTSYKSSNYFVDAVVR